MILVTDHNDDKTLEYIFAKKRRFILAPGFTGLCSWLSNFFSGMWRGRAFQQWHIIEEVSYLIVVRKQRKRRDQGQDILSKACPELLIFSS